MRQRFCFILAAFFFSHFAIAEDFTIQTFAGGGIPQNIQGTSAVLYGPQGIVTDASGNAFFTLGGQNIVLKLDSNGVLTLVAGNGTPGFSGDGGPATDAQLNAPRGIALDGNGSLYIADIGNARIRKVQNGVISTIAGGGTQTADNIPATDALLPTFPGMSRSTQRGTSTSKIPHKAAPSPFIPSVVVFGRSRTGSSRPSRETELRATAEMAARRSTLNWPDPSPWRSTQRVHFISPTITCFQRGPSLPRVTATSARSRTA